VPFLVGKSSQGDAEPNYDAEVQEITFYILATAWWLIIFTTSFWLLFLNIAHGN
jgi:hypothetical protein